MDQHLDVLKTGTVSQLPSEQLHWHSKEQLEKRALELQVCVLVEDNLINGIRHRSDTVMSKVSPGIAFKFFLQGYIVPSEEILHPLLIDRRRLVSGRSPVTETMPNPS